MTNALSLNTLPPRMARPQPRLRSLGDILDSLEGVAASDRVSIGAVIDEFGVRSFAPILLLTAMILVSPLSGIPGLPTIGAVLMLLMSVQKLMGRPQVWVPGWMATRTVAGRRLTRTVSWLRRPAALIDLRTHRRLPFLVGRTANRVTLAVIVAICLLIPFLEVLPMVTSFFAVGISFLAVGLFARDGLFTVFGYLWVGFSAWLLHTLVSAI